MMRKAYSKDSTGGEAAVKERSGAMPVLLMALACLIVGGANTVMSFNFTAFFTFIKGGHTEAIPQLLMNFLANVGHDAIEQIVGIVLILVVILLRKKYLSGINYKDFAVMALFFVASIVFGKIGSTSGQLSLTATLNQDAIASVGVKNGVVALVAVPNLVNWLCLSVFVLAKTGAKKLSRIFGGAVVLVSVVLSVVCCISARKLALLSYPESLASAAIPAVRVALLFSFVAFAVSILFWLLYGEGQLKFVVGIIYILVQPALLAILTVGTSIVGGAIGASKLGLGLAVSVLAEPIAYVLGGAAIVGILLIKKSRETKKAQKETVKA